MQLISSENENLGLINTYEALNMAQTDELNLVQIGFQNNIPVCRIMDYGKFKYKQIKEEAESRKKQPKNTIKEIKLSPRIDKHDIEIKMRKAQELLDDDFQVKILMQFRGRENSHKDVGIKVLEQFKALKANISSYKFEGNTIFLNLTKVS